MYILHNDAQNDVYNHPHVFALKMFNIVIKNMIE